MPFALPATSWKHQSILLYLHKNATLSRRPLYHEQTKDSQAGKFFLCVKSPTSHTSCMKQRAICASSDELEASIDPFVLAQECDVAPSPSAPRTNERFASRYFFWCVKCPISHTSCIAMCHLGLQRRPVSVNRRVLRFEGWPACSLAICAKMGWQSGN